MCHFLDGRLVEWLTAFGTIAAAASAVWLGLRQDRTKVLATAEFWNQGSIELMHSGPSALVVPIANAGSTRVTVIGAFWLIGRFRPSIMTAPIGGPNAWPLPISAKDSSTLLMAFADVIRTVALVLRERGGPLRLYLKLADGKRIKCRLTGQMKDWVKAVLS
jgi:hypothetical protein